MGENPDKRDVRLKVNVTPEERDLLDAKARASGQTRSDFMREAALGRRATVSPEKILDGIWVLNLVLGHLQSIAELPPTDAPDYALILLELHRIESMILMFAPVGFTGEDG
ncbi:ribbon-helix-helix protein, CopG family [Ruegeria lacuscaerulensis ITI-1157]|nr:ribbon-helix-helix protein, CopG family [Ruegeria lacuscaerulensis ITI-1157]SHK21776.1 Ribbon-helix-helix protein, copG family [Ruegeria lacuscaerulensis ITI-1157]